MIRWSSRVSVVQAVCRTTSIPMASILSMGVAVLSLKKKAVLQRAVPLAQAGIVNEARYRTRTLPAAGALLREEDSEEKQLTMELS